MWAIELELLEPGPGSVTVDAWIEKVSDRALEPHEQARFRRPDSAKTVSIPGTAREVFTVGSYVTRTRCEAGARAAVTDISAFSGRGPTRVGFAKPDLVAPGCQIGADGGVTSSCTALEPGGLPACPADDREAACCATFRAVRRCSYWNAAEIIQRFAQRTESKAGPSPACSTTT